jgi:hypothetical protein
MARKKLYILIFVLISSFVLNGQVHIEDSKLDSHGFISSAYIEIDNHSNSKELKSIFKKWEQIMIKDSIVDYKSEADCWNDNKMEELYKKGEYPMISPSQSVIELDFNNDNIKDYIINYHLANCVNGIGLGSWSNSFIFIKGIGNKKLEIDRDLTKEFKEKMAILYDLKFNLQVLKQANGYLHIPNVVFFNYQNGVISGSMRLELDNYYRPYGKFTYSFKEGDFLLFDSYDNL